MTTLTLIAAVGRNGVIGTGDAMVWHIPEDFAFFKATTMGHSMIMGRRTFDSIGRVLPGRRTIVVTRNRSWTHPGVEVAYSLDHALALTDGEDEVFVVGGGQIYRQAMPLANRLLITEVDQEPEGAVTFPEIDPQQWTEVSRVDHDGFAFVTHHREDRTSSFSTVGA